MDTPTKQRLVGAAVLIALAVIFLPMLVKGPAPDSGVSDVPLEVPAQPAADGMQTREIPLVIPQAGNGGALGAPEPVAEGERLPTVDTASPANQASGADPEDAAELATPASSGPASMAGGDYAVHFGAYASTGDADTVVRQLKQSQLPGYREQTTLNGRTAWRVRIGPYASRADAETVRLRAAQVRNDVRARVVALNADTQAPEPSAAPTASASPTASKPVAAPQATVKTEPLPEPKPAAPTPAPPAPAPAAKPAASGTGFAVQVGAFGNAAEATKLRDRLRASGFTAFTETVAGEKGSLTRVRVGPVLTRADADRLRGQISAKAGVSGMVRPHP